LTKLAYKNYTYFIKKKNRGRQTQFFRRSRKMKLNLRLGMDVDEVD